MARKRGNRWQADVEYQGQRKRPSFATQEAAEAWEALARKADAEGLPLPPTDNPNAPNGVTLGGFAREHYDFLWGDKKTAETMDFQLRVVLRHLGEDTPVASIREAEVVRMIGALKREGCANGTINRKLSCLSVILKHAEAMLGIKRPKITLLKEPKGRTRFLDKDEEERLCAYLLHLGLEETYHLVRFLLYTGCRRGEALGLQWRDIDWKRKTVTFWVTKGDEPRTVPLVGPALEALDWCRGQKRTQPFLIPKDTFRKHWDRAREALGHSDDPQYVPHVLRHTCASRLVQRGVDLRRVKQWMGHKNIQTTLRYAHLAPDDLDVAAKALVA